MSSSFPDAIVTKNHKKPAETKCIKYYDRRSRGYTHGAAPSWAPSTNPLSLRDSKPLTDNSAKNSPIQRGSFRLASFASLRAPAAHEEGSISILQPAVYLKG